MKSRLFNVTSIFVALGYLLGGAYLFFLLAGSSADDTPESFVGLAFLSVGTICVLFAFSIFASMWKKRVKIQITLVSIGIVALITIAKTRYPNLIFPRDVKVYCTDKRSNPLQIGIEHEDVGTKTNLMGPLSPELSVTFIYLFPTNPTETLKVRMRCLGKCRPLDMSEVDLTKVAMALNDCE